METFIHKTAIVEDGAKIGAGAKIGPFCMVGPEVELGEGCELVSHVAVAGQTTIGARTRIFPFASIGHIPQDLKYRGEPSTLTIGSDCTLREGVTMNPGTEGGGLKTVIGDRCAFLANSHVGHDTKVGNDVILSNNVMLAGHVTVGDFVIFGGGAAVIQFARVGSHAFVGGLTGLENDLIPYGMAMGNRAHLAGLNIIGLRRRGFTREQIHEIRRAYRLLFADEGTLAGAGRGRGGRIRYPSVHPRDPRFHSRGQGPGDLHAAGSCRRQLMSEPSGAKTGPVAILAGSGQLPIRLVHHLERTGQDCRVLAFRGFVSAELRRRADANVDLLDLKTIMRRLEEWQPRAVALVGAVRRPGFSALVGAYSLLRNRQEVREVIATRRRSGAARRRDAAGGARLQGRGRA